MIKKLLILTCLTIGFLSISVITHAQNLDSNTYRIVNPSINSGGGIATGSGYDLFFAIGETGGDVRLQSSSYSLNSGSPSTFQASVPTINCFETTTLSGTSTCLHLPNNDGLIGECGEPGCYDRAKLEIDDANNPIDTLYLVSLSTDNFVNEVFFLQSDHTLDSTFDINSYMTQCQLEGKDEDNPNCDEASDPSWNQNLQSYNIIGLAPNTTYQVVVRAVNGDFTETQYSSTVSASTSIPSIGFDIDVSDTDQETSAPYFIDLGTLSINQVNTAQDNIWIDLSTNSISGVNISVNSTSSGLKSVSTNDTIPSETEDLDIDDGDGGYGIKIETNYQQSLGPIIRNSAYDFANPNSVGALSTQPILVAYTSATGSNLGQISNGRMSISIKAKSYIGIAGGEYSDSLTFSAFSR